jgi:hypothetical protein
MTIAEFYNRYGCKLGFDSLQEAFHMYLACGHAREKAYRFAREYWRLKQSAVSK